MDKPLPPESSPVSPVDIAISLSSAESESSSRTEEEKLSNMRMIEDPVLTLCHFPSPGSNPDIPERKKSRVLPCVSLSLLCFSPPTATSPPSSPTLSRRDIFCPPELPTTVSSSLDKASSDDKVGSQSESHFDKIDDSLNTPVTAAEGTSFFGTTVPLLDPPAIGKSTISSLFNLIHFSPCHTFISNISKKKQAITPCCIKIDKVS